MEAPHPRGSRAHPERNSFVGRRRELAQVRRTLPDARLLTLVGPGGVGKTRLAFRAATDLSRAFPDGTVTVDLTVVRSQDLVAQQIAAALGVPDLSGERVLEQLTLAIGDRRLLLLLDHCEHVRDGAAVVVHELLSRCADLAVIATSRLPLDVDGESLLVVPPLDVPRQAPPEEALACEAVQLLIHRAQASTPTLRLTPDDAPNLLEICRRLDGLPLAIELAAVRLRTLGPQELVARLDDRFQLLRRSGAAIPERHRTLFATMQWSYDLLSEPERLLWGRACVFAGTFDVPAAEAVCADEALPAPRVLDAVTGLVDASLLDVVVQGTTSFRMLDTVRAFGRGQLVGSDDELARSRQRHRRWCSRLVAEAAAQFLGPDQVAAFDRLSRHHAEISGALDFCAATPGEQPAGLAMATDLWLYWEARDRLTEGRSCLDTLLAACPDDQGRARALFAAGYLALAAFEPEVAVPLLTQACHLAAAQEDPSVVALATQYLGQAALFAADLTSAEEMLQEAAARHEQLDERMAAFCWADLGVIALLQGRLDPARDAFARSLAQNANGNPWTRSHALWGLGLVHLGAGDARGALDHEREALGLMQAVQDSSGSALCLGALACVAAALGQWERAARLSGAEDRFWRAIPAQPPAPVVALHHNYLEAARQTLGPRRWAACYDEGGSLDRPAAVALALGRVETETTAPPVDAAGGAGPLTSRHLEVAQLVAQGLTDREIAARLVISPLDHLVRARVGVDDARRLAAQLQGVVRSRPPALAPTPKPTAVDPVNDTLSTSSCTTSASPISAP